MWNCNNPYADRDENLRKLGFKSYQEYCRSDFWSAIRAKAIRGARGRCQRCGSGRELQVHHRAYDLATLAGVNLKSLTVACAHCHCKAERPGDFTRTRYERLVEASELLLQDEPTWLEHCRIWFGKHSRFLTSDVEPQFLVARKIAADYVFCGNHPWGTVRACMDALTLAQQGQKVA